MPDLLQYTLNESRLDFVTTIKKSGVKAIDDMMNIIWYEFQIKYLGQGKKPNPNLSPWTVFLNYLWLIIQHKLKSKKSIPSKG